jgi:phosphatidylethanolamine/phosphatidyl-N-methylethanolamine N-methyltransferase
MSGGKPASTFPDIAQPMKGGQAEGRRAFLKSLKERPRLTGAIAPSGKALSRLMARFVDPADPLPVLELGPGTGVVTDALVARGVGPEKIVAVEYNPDLCLYLAGRFPGAAIIEGDAYDLGKTLPAHQSGPFSAVVSSLPLLTRPYPVRQALIEQALDRMAPGRPVIQFSYSLFAPPVAAVKGRFTVEHSPWVLTNLPPARVWLYRRAA